MSKGGEAVRPKAGQFSGWAGSVDSHPHVWFFCAIQRLSPRARANGVGQDRDRSVHGERGRGLISASTEDPEPNETVETRMILDWSGPLHLGTASRLDAPSQWVTG